MDWIRVDVNLPHHPKVLKLGLALRIHPIQALGHVQALWSWAAQFGPKGDLSRFDALDIAVGCGWDGDADQLVSALVKVGLLDQVEGGAGLHLHDWYEHQGKLIERTKERVAKLRKGVTANPPGDTTRIDHPDIPPGSTTWSDTKRDATKRDVTNKRIASTSSDPSSTVGGDQVAPEDPPGEATHTEIQKQKKAKRGEGGFQPIGQVVKDRGSPENGNGELSAYLREVFVDGGNGLNDAQIKKLQHLGLRLQQAYEVASLFDSLMQTPATRPRNPIGWAYKSLENKAVGKHN